MLLAVAFLGGSVRLFALEIVAPEKDAVVPVLTAVQKRHLDIPDDRRQALFSQKDYRAKLTSPQGRPGWYPAPVVLAWKGDAAAEYEVVVRRAADGKVFYTGKTKGTRLELDNFEIACAYEWTVKGADGLASSSFSTEDRAPRLLRDPFVPNVRDLGGRMTSFGRRVRQNRIFRTAGLNDNASEARGAELEKALRELEGTPLKAQVDGCRAAAKEFRALSTSKRKVPYVALDWAKDGAWGFHDVGALFAAAFADAMAEGRRVEATKFVKPGQDGFVRLDGEGLAYLDRTFSAPADGYAVLEVTGDSFWALEVNGILYSCWYDGKDLTQYHPVFVAVRKGENRIGILLKSGRQWCIDCHPGVPGARDYAKEAADGLDWLSEHALVRIPGRTRIHDGNRDFWLKTLGVKSDIDLRTDGECYGMTGSPLGPSVKWFHYSSQCYEGMAKQSGREAFAKVFRVFLDEANYPIAFHCIAGQDRTGAVAYILLALLGVEESEVAKDWEASGFWQTETNWFSFRTFNRLPPVFKAYEGKNLRERVEKYVLSLGFTMADIEKFRSLMLK